MSINDFITKVGLTLNSTAYFARNGSKPNGILSYCKAYYDCPPEQYDIYQKLIRMETDKLAMPLRPRIILNCIQVADQGYREMQFNIRVSYRGKEAGYLNHILINNFWGWIAGVSVYGYNKFLCPIDYTFDRSNSVFKARVPGNQPYFQANFERADIKDVPEFSNEGQYSITKNRLIFCRPSTSSLKDFSRDSGYLHVTRNAFIENESRCAYPTLWSELIPEGSYPAILYHGYATNVFMEPIEILETW